MRNKEDQDEEHSSEEESKKHLQEKKTDGDCFETWRERGRDQTWNKHFWLGLWESFVEAQKTGCVSLYRKMSSVLIAMQYLQKEMD